MKILVEWLKEFVDAPAQVEELRHRLTMCGVAVDAVTESPAGTLLELDVTTNRPDLLSHYGVAREISTLYGQPLKKLNPIFPEAAEAASSVARVEIAEPDLCGRYVALIFRNVKVKPSPDFIRQRLEACGLAAINNVVDATNYVLLELGHPMHAFDLDQLADRHIIVRRARAGEGLRTLDSVERTLRPHQLVIADARRAVALAGIMGGAETEISFRTQNVLLESAWFDPATTRRTAKDFGLRTEASYRFERGMDPEAPLVAARRCAELIVELAGAEVLAGALDVYPKRWQAPVLTLRQSEILRVLGAPVPEDFIERVLRALGFGVTRTVEASWQVTVPSWRPDVTREIDFVEEVARHYGYDKFPSRLPAGGAVAVRLPHAEKEARLRQVLEALGYDEVISFSLVHPDDAARFSAAEPVRLLNPLSEETSVLRTTGLVSMVQTLEWNLNRGQRDVCFYEIGKAYSVAAGKPQERRVLTLGATGTVRQKSAHERARTYDFFDLKGAVEAVLELFALDQLEFRPLEDSPLFDSLHAAAVFASPPGQAQPIQLGMCGQFSPALTQAYKLRQKVFLAELDLEALYRINLRPRRYQPISRFPAVERDFSLLLDETVTFSAVRDTIAALKVPELTSVQAIDQFRGHPVPAGRYSLLIRVTFQSHTQTLTDDQVNTFSQRIIRALESALGAQLRA